uniref:Uncharacterized protein n=1 Tax=Arundo donax TaxID=35708 RepID=A0A0A8Z346_ARUDO
MSIYCSRWIHHVRWWLCPVRWHHGLQLKNIVCCSYINTQYYSNLQKVPNSFLLEKCLIFLNSLSLLNSL